MRPRQNLPFQSIFGLVAISLLAGCEKDPCEEVCVRVAECRRERPAEEAMLGEKTPNPDKKCKERCRNNPDGFATCEAKKKTCPDLLACTEKH